MKHLSKIIALSLALLLTVMAAVPSLEATGYFTFAASEETAQSEENTSADEKADLQGAEAGRSAKDASDAEEAVEAGESANKGAEKDSETSDAKADDTDKVKNSADKDKEDKTKNAESIEFKGKEFDVTIDSTPEAGLPADTKLKVGEIAAKDKEYKDYYKKALAAVRDDAAENSKDKDDVRAVRFVRLYDFELTAGGEALEPDANVDVSIDYSKAVRKGKAEAAEDPDSVRIIHFTEDKNSGEIKADLLASKHTDAVIEDSALTEAKFEAESFSVYAVVYTVDFHYGDGEYDFSIAGESSIMLSEVIDRLHIGDLTVSDVKAVKFSDPDLIKVEKEESQAEDGTGTLVDWKLTSLKAFDTDETLTLTLRDESEVVIGVTDAQVNNEADANFKVINRSNGNASLQTVTYWENFAEAIDQANLSSSNYPAKIEVLKDVTITDTSVYSKAQALTIEGNNHTVTRGAGLSGNIIHKSNSNGAVEISNLTINNGFGSSDSIVFYSGAGTNTSLSLTNVTLEGGSSTGHLIEADTTRPIVLTDCSLTGSQISNAQSLIYRELGNNIGDTTLTNVAIDAGSISGDVIQFNITSGTRAMPLSIADCMIKMNNCTGSVVNMNTAVSNNNKVSITNTTVTGPTISSTKDLFLLQPTGTTQGINLTITDTTIYRGCTTGAAINNSSTGKTSITNSTISGAKSENDASSITASSPLVKQGTGALTLANAVIEKHVASTAGVCAVDASVVTAANHVHVEGNTSIIGNTAGGNPANLKVSGTNVLEIDTRKHLTGKIGVYNTDKSGDGDTFAHLGNEQSSTGANNFSNDINTDLRPVQNVLNVSWKGRMVYETLSDPDPDVNATVTYPVTQEVNVEHDLTIPVPLTKTLTLNRAVEDTSVIDDIKFVFDIEVTSGDQTGVETSTFKLPVSTILAGSHTGNTYTFTVDEDDPEWTIKFTKEGQYTLTIKETGVEPADNVTGITTDSSTQTLTYNIVENEGRLRIAEVYKASSEEITGTPVTGHDQEELSLDNLFYTHTSRNSPTVTRSGNTITMTLPDNSAAAITSEFSFDFSRSFEISGNMKFGAEDGVAFAFQTKAKVQSYMREGAYGLDDHNFSTGTGTTGQTAYLREGSPNSTTYKISDSDMGNGFLFVMLNEPLSGMGGFRMNGINRIPYPATNGVFGTQSSAREFDNHYVIIGSGEVVNSRITNGTVWDYLSTLPYKVKFDCTDPSIGKGRLTITVLGQTIEYDGFVAKNMFGDSWHEAYFVIGSAADNGVNARTILSISDFHYTDGIDGAESNATFWADRNGDGLYETQVNTTDSLAIPGETILVRHKLIPANGTGYDHDFFMKALVTQLKDITNNSEMSPISYNAVSWVPGTTTAMCVKDESANAYNKDVLADGMFVPVLKNKTYTYFEYRIQAPASGHTVIESAMFGEPPFPTTYTGTTGFKTENIAAQNVTLNNSAELFNVTFNPDGGTFSDNTTANKVVNALSGSTFTVNEEPTKANNVFVGWKLDDDHIYKVGDTFTVDNDVTLTAQWKDSADLTITKTASGDYADLTREYTFTVTLPTKTGGYTATKYASATATTGTDITSIGATGGNFTLKTGERIVIKEIPLNQPVEVEETGMGTSSETGEDGNYKITPAFTAGTVNEDYEELAINGTKATFKLMNDATLRYTNYLNGVVPSGLKIATGIVALALVIVLAMLYAVTFRRRKRA